MFDIFGLRKKFHTPTILVVEDEPAIAQSVQDRLEMDKYRVILAADGKQGLDIAARQKPDLILLDVNMPVMDGFEMLEALRKNPDTANCPVIMITVRSQKDDITRAEAAGVDDYIVKPFDFPPLLQKIETVLEKHSKKTTKSH
jgi:DNA-binding response OmpR family regulator